MSQMGVEGHLEVANENLTYRNLPGNDVNQANPFANHDDEYTAQRVAILLVFSVIGLLGNFLTILLVMVTKQLQKPNNSFFMHQCVLDTVKSAYCFVFSKSLLHKEPPADCAILGATYIVFITASAFNILAITINELYHFTNVVVGNEPSNKCCVLFGLGIIWFASIIINLGVAFLPGTPKFDRAVGYCTFMYGVTGNYLLHVIWIVLISVALLLTILYLRKYWLDIQHRACYRIAVLFHNTMQLRLDPQQQQSKKNHQHELHVQKAIKTARKNLFLLVAMVIIFILFWYPLFFLTLGDRHFKVDPTYYKTLTIVAWCHPSLTPFLFIAYNVSSFKDLQEKIIWKHNRKDSTQSLNSASHRTYPITSESESTPCSPLRPNSLNVTPVYNCKNHLSLGTCIEGDCTSASHSGQKTNYDSNKINGFPTPTTSSRQTHKRLIPDPSTNGFSGTAVRQTSKSFEQPRLPKTNSNPWLQRASCDTLTDGFTAIKYNKMGNAYNHQQKLNRLEIVESLLPSEPVNRLIESSVANGINKMKHKTNRSSMRQSAIDRTNSDYDNDSLSNQQTFRKLTTSHSLMMPSHKTPTQHLGSHRKTIPSHMALAGHMSTFRSDTGVQVENETTPSSQLTVHRVSTGCLTVITDLSNDASKWV